MAENKTQKTKASVAAFINGIAGQSRWNDCRTVLKLMKDATGAPARMWGPVILANPGLADDLLRSPCG